jgi:hypothetical protein
MLTFIAATLLAQVPVDALPVEPSSPPTASRSGQRFVCQNQGGFPIVAYQPQSQPNSSFPWAAPGAMGGGWSADRRCQEISRRLESYRPDGLVELQTSVENGYNTICATTERNPTCRIILTVPVGQDPVATRDRVFSNLLAADGGQQTTAINTFRARSRRPFLGSLGNWDLGLPEIASPPTAAPGFRGGIDLKPFLDPSDGGTGAALFVPGRRFPRSLGR